MKYKKQKLTYAILLATFLSACQAPPPVKNVADDVGALKIPNKYIIPHFPGFRHQSAQFRKRFSVSRISSR